MAVQRKAAGSKIVGGEARRRRRPRPPWGSILKSKPIARHAYAFNKRIDLGEDYVRLMQRIKMLQLKDHYKIFGAVDDPIRGVAPATWEPWYKLALAIACDLDDSLKIGDAKPPGKTAPRWRGVEGLVLLDIVEALKEWRPERPIRWCLQWLQKKHLKKFGQISLSELEARYYDAKQHHGTTKRNRYSEPAS